jgi:MoaA/NifB/PqqE/SkfB family radical SAM enzyme
MCYFSDENKRKQMKGSLKEDDLPLLAKAFFHRTLKLQIGCGAEPALFPYNKILIKLGKAYRVPYIAITTNGHLYSDNDWQELVAAGLDEITLSLHGVKRETYEYFMQNASFDKFLSAMACLTKLKEKYPHLKVRLNYTVNKDNLVELQDFFSVFGAYRFDILQIRPIQKMGDTAYNHFSWDTIYNSYDSILEQLKNDCCERNITVLIPDKQNIMQGESSDGRITEATYFYVRPRYYWMGDFDLEHDTYETYSRRTHWGRHLLGLAFRRTAINDSTRRHLNYGIN